MGKLDFNDLHLERGYTPIRAYGNAKLANILFTRGLVKHLQGTKITANSLHPGLVNTGFAKEYQGFFAVLVNISRFFMLTPAKGARTSVYLASSPEVEGVTGKYFIRCKVARESAAARDDAAAERLWQISAELTKVQA
jgi:NAD(P)-dependent dehydrogenase (short-subunit alcohol dehydrogenase family)